MESIINPIHPDIIEKELKEAFFVRKTNYGNNLIYDIDANQSPNTMLELGRLREKTFRDAGGGTGKSVDIDEYDTSENPFRQLIVWNPEEKDIIGSYRYKHGKTMCMQADGQPISPTSHLFHFSDKFIKEYLPYTIELGRSFVQTKYQPIVDPRKGLYALDNTWDGLGYLVHKNPDIKYFFGKMTMYNSYPLGARDLILYVLQKHFSDKEQLVVPLESKPIITDSKILFEIFTEKSFKADFRILVKKVREYNVNIPPLVNIYMGLTSTMKCFGTSANVDFGPVEETGIMITISDIYPAKRERHVNY